MNKLPAVRYNKYNIFINDILLIKFNIQICVMIMYVFVIVECEPFGL